MKQAPEALIIASTTNIYLRKLCLEDAQFILDLTNQKAWLENIGDRNIYSIKDARRFLKKGPMQAYKTHNFGLYLIAKQGSHEPIGVCGLIKRTYLNAPDLGFAISERYYRKGYAFEASRLVLSNALQVSQSSFIYAATKKGNTPSQLLLTKLGFKKLPQALVISDEQLVLFKRSVV